MMTKGEDGIEAVSETNVFVYGISQPNIVILLKSNKLLVEKQRYCS